MRTRIYLFPVILIFLLSLSGCAATWGSSSIDKPVGATQKTYEPTPMENIIITSDDITDRKYEVIGDIVATVNKTTIFHSNPTRELLNKKFKEEAAAVGADAVILVRYGEVGMSLMSYGSLEGKGRAIKFISE